jgi:hypothetical protein
MSSTLDPLSFTVFEIIKPIRRYAYVSELNECVIMLLATEEAAGDFRLFSSEHLRKKRMFWLRWN